MEEIERGLGDTAVTLSAVDVGQSELLSWQNQVPMPSPYPCSLGKIETEPTVAAVRLHFTATVQVTAKYRKIQKSIGKNRK